MKKEREDAHKLIRSKAKAKAGKGIRRSRSDDGGDGRPTTVREVPIRTGTTGAKRQPNGHKESRGSGVRTVRGSSRKASAEVSQTHQTGSGDFLDRSGKPLYKGAQIRYHTYGGSVLIATVQSNAIVGHMVEILINKDPYTVYADHRQLELIEGKKEMPTATKTPAKELRRQAKNLGIQGFMEMGRNELESAIVSVENGNKADKQRTEKKPAKTKKVKVTKEAKAKKVRTAPARVRKEQTGPNPFRPGTNLWHISEALMKGGKRSTLVQKLLPKLEYNPRLKTQDFDPVIETDRRLKVVGYLLKNRYNFTYEHVGRGEDATIKVVPPEQ